MIRNVNSNDFEVIHNLLADIDLSELDINNSLIDIYDDCTVNAFVLSRKSVLKNKLKKGRFPKNRSNRDLVYIYSKANLNDHEIFALYRRERNGRALNKLFHLLLTNTNGLEIWWLDKESEFVKADNFNKLSGLMNIKPTSLYFTNF